MLTFLPISELQFLPSGIRRLAPLECGEQTKRMSFFHRISGSNFFIKLRSWEYWPFGIIRAPLFIYWVWLSLKARSLFFFSASNPGILMGGMFGESKFEVLEKVPEECRAKAILIRVPASVEAILIRIRENGFEFPLIFKPDLGERGWLVKRINHEDEVKDYLSQIKVDFLIQEFVELPLEFGVFYVRYPKQASGKVISVVGKEMLTVEGDGKKTLKELIFGKARAKLQWETLQVTLRGRLEEVLPMSHKLELVSIGNHCLGTKFLNCNHLITEGLSNSFDRISKQVDGFYFGRYDLRVASLEDLENGSIKVVELNGCGAEPAHIYEPGFSLWEAQKVLFQHWKHIYRISAENHAQGVSYISFQEGRAIYNKFRSLTS